MAVAAPKSSPKRRRKTNSGNGGGSRRAAQRERRQAWVQGGCSKEQLKKEIKEGEKLARQGDSCSQEKPQKGNQEISRRKTGLVVIIKVTAKDLRPNVDSRNPRH